MVKESICNYEQANRLKRLGFDWECWRVFERSESGPFPFFCKKPVNFNAESYYVSAPTTEMAHRWLREKMQFSITINPQKDTKGNLGYNYSVFNLKDLSPIGWADEIYSSYEDALSAALDYAIECAVILYGKDNYKIK